MFEKAVLVQVKQVDKALHAISGKPRVMLVMQVQCECQCRDEIKKRAKVLYFCKYQFIDGR